MNTQTISIDSIKEDFNPRSDFGKVDDIADSIKRIGLLQPLVVKQSGHDATTRLVDGACRLRALKKLGIKEVQVIFVDSDSADEAQLAANLMRADLNILERARGYTRLLLTQPTKYNALGISKTFGTPKKTVERMVAVAKALPVKFDAKLGSMIEHIDLEDLETLSNIPNDGKMAKVVDAITPNGNSPVYQAIDRTFKQLYSWNTDALTVNKLVSAGRAFQIGSNFYTEDAEALKEAQKAYELKNKQSSGSGEGKKLSEKEKEARSKKIKKDREERAEARKVLPELLKKLLAAKPTEKEVDALGEEICGRHLNHDSSQRLAAMFGVTLKNSSCSIREACYRQVFKPMCTTPESIVKLHAIVKEFGYSSEADWLKRLKK